LIIGGFWKKLRENTREGWRQLTMNNEQLSMKEDGDSKRSGGGAGAINNE